MKYQGLTNEQAEESRKKHGSNAIPDSEPATFWSEFKETFSDPMIKILLVIAAVMIIMFFFGYAKIYEPVGTITAVIIVAFVSAKTGVASDTKYREIKESTKKDTCKAYRNGQITVINVDDVVVGDKVLLQSGDKIPADGILVDGMLSVDNSALNGETEECRKTPGSEDLQLGENITGDTFVDKHSLFRGAVIFDGEGVLDVRRVGLKTMMGKMAEEMQEDEPDTPLKVKLGKLADQISMFGYIGAVVIAVLYMAFFVINAGGVSMYFAQGWNVVLQDIVEAVSLAIVIIVCAVPEGLPLMISLVLMQNTSKMLDHNVLVRKAQGIETAGSLNILFSDKTGTITKGMLEAVEFFTAEGETIPLDKLGNYRNLKQYLDLAIGKNTASMYDDSHNVIGGNATDRALMKFLGEDTYSDLNSNKDYSDTVFQGFNSVNKFSQAYIPNLGKTFYKGAPEKLLAATKKAIDKGGNVIALDEDKVNERINELASRAMRVLAFGYSEKELAENVINSDTAVIGFIAIRDDVRPEARSAIREVQEAGIQVVMITGDRLETAVSIARDAGLVNSGSDISLTSAELNNMSDEEVKEKIKNIRVIARALPTDKSRMVRLCQEMNLVVGMTGDGVNDSAALKRADVGFAMGSGLDSAKEASEIVILDDNFKSIESAVLYGRTIYLNILKFCKFQLVINIAAVIISALSPFFGINEPLKVTHLLFVNLVMDGLGAIMLGNEPAHDEYMKDKPRRRDENIISKQMAGQILTMGLWVTVLSFVFLKLPFFDRFFDNEEQKLTAYFVLFIVTSLFNAFNVRDDGFAVFKDLNANPGFIKVFFAIIIVQAFIVNSTLIPLPVFKWIGEMFSCVPFGIAGWICVFVLAALIIPVDFIRKAIVGKKR